MPNEIEWKVIYVGSAENSSFDQILEEVEVGPIPLGINKFILETEAPDPSLIPERDLLGITVMLVTCSYRDQEFARVGYYVNNEYRLHPNMVIGSNDQDQEGEIEIPSPMDLSQVWRTIVADKPRVTRFPIQWSDDIEENGTVAENQNDENHEIEGEMEIDIDAEMEDFVETVEAHSEDDALASLSLVTSPGKSQIVHGIKVVSPEWSDQSNIMVE